MRVILLSFILFASSPVFSQHEEHWEDAVLKWLDAEELESRSIEDSYDILSALAEHPLNINQVTREELEQLPFLTDLQVEEIMAYINRYGMIRSAGELQMLTTLDAERRRLLRFFIYFGEPERPNRTLRIDSILQHSHKQLLVTDLQALRMPENPFSATGIDGVTTITRISCRLKVWGLLNSSIWGCTECS